MSKGLKNRFPKSVFEFWDGYYTDMIDGRNDADCLHHIMSQGSFNYKAGDFNKSIFNSCPLSNNRNHLYNTSLHKPETEKLLLKKVADVIMSTGYRLKDIDIEFYRNYKKLYE